MKLYTRKGDKGSTGILGKDRLSKDDIRIEAYGTIDELNAVLGTLYHYISEELKDELRQIQSILFEIGSELASVKPRDKITADDVKHLEDLIDAATEPVPEMKSFVLPGGSESASWLHMARTITRRAERRIVTFTKEVDLNKHIVAYVNRLSDLFFAWARFENHTSGIDDIPWKARS